jgi:DNA-binding MarR family transcriptional regulator
MMNQSALVYLQIDVRPPWPTCLYDDADWFDLDDATLDQPDCHSSQIVPNSKTEDAEVRASIALADLWSRSIRQRHLTEFHVSDPVWGILLDIYVAESKGLQTSLSSSGYAALAPRSTSMRWVNVLIREGKLIREPDPADRRRSWVKLSNFTRDALDKYFAELVQSHRYRLHLKAIVVDETDYNPVQS